MEITDQPAGYFITWTVYGTFLHGDTRWWRNKQTEPKPPRPRLEYWHRNRLKHDVILLNETLRSVARCEIERHCEHRAWKLWVANPRTNHVHVVVTAPGYLGTRVRDQLKANCTRGLRAIDERLVERPIWTTKGDVQVLDSDDDLEQAIIYAGEAQDRAGRGK